MPTRTGSSVNGLRGDLDSMTTVGSQLTTPFKCAGMTASNCSSANYLWGGPGLQFG